MFPSQALAQAPSSHTYPAVNVREEQEVGRGVHCGLEHEGRLRLVLQSGDEAQRLVTLPRLTGPHPQLRVVAGARHGILPELYTGGGAGGGYGIIVNIIITIIKSDLISQIDKVIKAM